MIGHWTVTAKSAENEDILISGNASSGRSNNYILDTSSMNLAKLNLEKFYKTDKKHQEGDYCEHGYRLTVNLLSTSGETEEKDFMFYITPRLAPGKPIISNPHFIFENYDWEYDSMYDNTPPSEFTFDLYSENATTFELHLVMSKGDYNYFTIDDWYNGKDNGVNITYHNGWGEVADGQATYLSTNVIGKGGQDWGEIILIRGY